MRTVGAFEGKTHFAQLLAEAERGETIVITRNGKPVAPLGPVASPSRLTAEQAMQRMLSLNITLGAPIREFIEEGRKY